MKRELEVKKCIRRLPLPPTRFPDDIYFPVEREKKVQQGKSSKNFGSNYNFRNLAGSLNSNA